MIIKFKIFENSQSGGGTWGLEMVDSDSIEDDIYLYPIGSKIVCINSSHAVGIKEGEIYEVEDNNNLRGRSAYKLVGISAWYIADRFLSILEYDAKKYNL